MPRSETPAGEKVYSSGDNLTSDDLKALLADVNDLDKCDRKHGDKALEALLDGDTKEARRQVKRMLGGDASKSEVDAMLTKLKKLSQVLSMSKDDLLASLRAGKPGAAPVSGKSVEREAQELDSLFGRADSDPNRPRRAKRKRGGRCGGCGCKKNKDKEATLRNALVKLKELEEASTSRELGGETPKKDLDGALADMGRPA